MENTNPKKIEGTPTKELFVFILTRDLSIEDAINDLIDNCIDGAKRLRPDNNYEGLVIDIQLNENTFIIKDNCGGIDIDIARKYAFRFGRASGTPKTDFSIGQFGVGMKRAFFKLGKAFYVESKFINSEFAITVNIEDWLAKTNADNSEDWSFEFDNDFKENQKNNADETGTKIEITPLNENVIALVEDMELGYLDKLKSGIEIKQMENIYSGIKITVNEDVLTCRRPKFVTSEEIKIAQFKRKFDSDVELRILCGIGEPKEEEGGWYIFCNNRLLLGPEQTALTGWTGKGGGGVAHYHHQYRRFRGIVYFNAIDSFKLPWNTSKNDIEVSSPIFLFARGKMIEMMKPVVKLLNLDKKDRETLPDGSEKPDKPYEAMISNAKVIELKDLREENFSTSFEVPNFEIPNTDLSMVNISYKKPKELVERVKAYLKITTPKQVGELTFDYFINQEEIDNE